MNVTLAPSPAVPPLCSILPVDQDADLFDLYLSFLGARIVAAFHSEECCWASAGVPKVDCLKCFTSPGLMPVLPVSGFDALLQCPHPPTPPIYKYSLISTARLREASTSGLPPSSAAVIYGGSGLRRSPCTWALAA